MNTISYEDYQDLCDTHCFDPITIFNKKLENWGIEARPYTGYQYFDSLGNYLGDSNDVDVRELLKNAYIEIGD